jgi:hypothetical protein
MNLDVLVCKKNSTVHHKAQEMLGAMRSGKIPESNDNDGNAGASFRILPLDYLANAGYWYFMDSSRALTDMEGFQFVESQPLAVEPTNVVYKTREIQVAAGSIFTLGFNDVTRSWVASNGTSA